MVRRPMQRHEVDLLVAWAAASSSCAPSSGAKASGELWFTRRSLLLDRLVRGATIEMDGVSAMEHFYAAGGFVAQHRDLRFAGMAGERQGERIPAPTTGEVVDLRDVPFELVEAYDRAHFPAPRPTFLRRFFGVTTSELG